MFDKVCTDQKTMNLEVMLKIDERSAPSALERNDIAHDVFASSLVSNMMYL